MKIDNQEKTDERLVPAIMRVVVFFDLFNYPLTDWEVWQYLKVAATFYEVRLSLISLSERQLLACRTGYYFLPGREDLVAIRRERYNYTNRKIKLARRLTHLFHWLPTVKLVAISNLIGHHNLRSESDIDIFIISADKYLWLTRLFCTGLMKIAGKRPTPECKKDKMCLSFYASVSGTALESLRLRPDDPYFEYWLLDLFTIYDRDQYLDLIYCRNPWLKKIFPNNLSFARSLSEDYGLTVVTLGGLGPMFDRVAKTIQLAIMPNSLKDLAASSSGVIINDQLLRFYLNDRRAEFRQKYYAQLAVRKTV